MIKRLTAIVLSLVLCMCMFAVPTNAADSSNVAQTQNDEVKVIKGEDTGISTVDFQRGGWGMSKVERSVYTDSKCLNRVEDYTLPAGVGFSIVEETSGAYRIDTYCDINVYLCGVWITKGNLTLDFSTACAASIIGNAVSVYGGVGTTNYEKVAQVEYFDVVVLLAKSGDWYYIECNDSYYLRVRGWIPAKNIYKYDSTFEPGPLDTLVGVTTRLSSVDMNVYYAPGSGYAPYAQIPAGMQYSLEMYVTINGKDYARVSFIPHNGAKVCSGYIRV